MSIKRLLSLALCLSLLAGCSVVPGFEPSSKGMVKPKVEFDVAKTAVSDYEIQELKKNSALKANQMGFELFKDMVALNTAGTDGPDNMLFSPTSLAFALAMLQNGAVGDTQSGILNVMGEESLRLNEDYENWLTYFNQISQKRKDEVPGLVLDIANSIWFKAGIKTKQPFVDTLSASYDAQVYTVDFSLQETIGSMNKWVEEQTNGLLKDTFSVIDPMTVAVLMNTVYFKGTWRESFAEEATSKEPFLTTSGESVDVDMMHQFNSFAYAENDQLQVAGLPYYGRATMWVFLPKNDIMDLMNLQYADMDDLIQSAWKDHQRLDLKFPKLDYSVKNPLSELLKSAGMEQAFSPENADFSAMIEVADENIFVSEIFQNAKIIVDEKGTEAAAVTVVEVAATSMPIETEPKPFYCNKPFMVVIQDDLTGSMLFVGMVEKP